MKRLSFAFIVCLFFSCKTTTWYISRHAEKADNSANPPLSARGEQQAIALRDYLNGKSITTIYSTAFIRTRSTAAPTSAQTGVAIKTYTPPMPSTVFIDSLKALRGNALIVGHSNTVDDLVNGLMSRQTLTDLADSEYGDVFIVKKKGSKTSFERIKLTIAN